MDQELILEKNLFEREKEAESWLAKATSTAENILWTNFKLAAEAVAKTSFPELSNSSSCHNNQQHSNHHNSNGENSSQGNNSGSVEGSSSCCHGNCSVNLSSSSGNAEFRKAAKATTILYKETLSLLNPSQSPIQTFARRLGRVETLRSLTSSLLHGNGSHHGNRRLFWRKEEILQLLSDELAKIPDARLAQQQQQQGGNFDSGGGGQCNDSDNDIESKLRTLGVSDSCCHGSTSSGVGKSSGDKKKLLLGDPVCPASNSHHGSNVGGRKRARSSSPREAVGNCAGRKVSRRN